MSSGTEGSNIGFPEIKERKSDVFSYHHARPLNSVVFDIVKPVSPLNYQSDKEAQFFDRAYKWLEGKLGFYPMFLAVGKTDEDKGMTGYQNQWRKLLALSKNHRTYRQKGDIENKVLFSFDTMPPNGVFVDYDNWHIVLNSSDRPQEIEKHTSSIFRPSWIKNDWISYSNRKPYSVQLIVPSLDLRTASEVLVRNKETQRDLVKLGFNNVKVARLPVNSLS